MLEFKKDAPSYIIAGVHVLLLCRGWKAGEKKGVLK